MRTISALFCLGLLWVALPAQEKASRSPFLPPDAPNTGAPVATETEFEFNGLVTAGGRTLVCVTSVREQRSRWIAVGAQADGIKVVSHDSAAQRITIEQAGRSRSLQLKRSTPRPDAPAAEASPLPVPAAPLPVAAVAEPVPTTNEEKEREARMLVSDLLEIGMIQRKAYEDAQQKKAKGEAAGATAAPETPSEAPAPESAAEVPVPTNEQP
jgi:hypothetical protein